MAKKTGKDVTETVQKLVTLAQDDKEGDSEEARNAAHKACLMLKEHDLVIVPREEAEKAARVVEGTKELAMRIKKDGQKNMILGAALGWFAAGKFGR